MKTKTNQSNLNWSKTPPATTGHYDLSDDDGVSWWPSIDVYSRGNRLLVVHPRTGKEVGVCDLPSWSWKKGVDTVSKTAQVQSNPTDTSTKPVETPTPVANQIPERVWDRVEKLVENGEVDPTPWP